MNKYNNEWTEEQINFVKENHLKMTQKDIAKTLGKCNTTVSVLMNKLNLPNMTDLKFKWTDDEVKFLKENYSTMTYKEIGLILGKESYSVSNKIRRLKLKKAEAFSNYTEEEVSFIMENIDKLTYKEIANKLNRPVKGLISKCHDMGIKLKENRVKLKREQILFIIANYDKYTDTELGVKFKVSDQAIADVRKAYGIIKTGTEVKGSTYIESVIKSILDKHNIEYIFNQKDTIYKPDFLIKNKKIVIEAQGDYYHCNPKIYGDGPKDDVQIKHVLNDYYKKCYYISRGYLYLEIWEYDINRNIDEVEKNILSAVLNGNI